MKPKHIHAHMQVAHVYANCSTAERLKVGAIVVKDDRIISIGYNGMPAGWDNVCEEKEWMNSDAGGWLDPEEIDEHWPYVAKSDLDDSYIGRYRLKTRKEVLHAERNALDKLAKGNEGGEGASIFITHAPCLECAKSIYGAGITDVYYATDYRSTDGLEFLTKCGVKVTKLDV